MESSDLEAVKGRGTKSQRRARSGGGNRSGLPSTYPSDLL